MANADFRPTPHVNITDISSDVLTRFVEGSNTASISVTNSSMILATAITTIGGDVDVVGKFTFGVNAAAFRRGTLILTRNGIGGTELDRSVIQWGNTATGAGVDSGNSTLVVLKTVDTPPTGTNTYAIFNIDVRDGGLFAEMRRITLIEINL